MAKYELPAQRGIKLIMSKVIIPRMDEREITRYRMSKELGVHQSTIKRWLECTIDISLKDFLRICGLLEINPYLLPKENDDNPKTYEHFN